MSAAVNDPRQWWGKGGRTPTLSIGTVLRAREVEDPDDPMNVVVVVGVHFAPRGEEAVIRPLLFGDAVAAPVTGPGSLLSVYDVLTEEEAAALLPAAEASDPTPLWVAEVRRDLEAARDRRDAGEAV